MLETPESLLPASPVRGRPLRVFVAGVDPESLQEMLRLLETLGVQVGGQMLFQNRSIHPATYVGRGKLDEMVELFKNRECDAVIFDVELSPNQLRNLEKEFGNRPLLDRPGVIIEIFSRHARTRESKTQVELARLQYLYPRLSHLWTHFERQRGGGTGMRGMGEKQIEVDRRLVKKRISILKGRLEEIQKERKVQRSSRQDIYKVALVGYTNAGKSTLLNALTQSRVLAEDKLFATLDSSVRALDPDAHPPVVAIDTVGFIRNLPPSLVASFRSTLEELFEADLLLHVVDASSDQAGEQYEVTRQILKDLGLGDKPAIVALNKADLLTTPAQRNSARVISPGAVFVSAMNAEEVRRLRDQILSHFRTKMEVYEVFVPYTQSKIESQFHAHGVIEQARHFENGTFYRLRMDPTWAGKLELAKFRI